MTAAVNPVIYVNVFDQPFPSKEQQDQFAVWAADLSGSGFQTVILYNIHIDAYGNIHGNAPLVVDGQLQAGYAYLPQLIATLQNGGSVQRVLMCIGGWGSEGDYVHAGQIMTQYGAGPESPLVRNLVALQAIGVDGIDFDLEADAEASPLSYPYAYYVPIVVQLVTILHNLHMTITFCPYTAAPFWLACLASCYAQFEVNPVQPVAWMNLQCYSGGSGNTQTQWVDYLIEYQKDFDGPDNYALGSLGIADPAGFIVPGYGVPGICPPGLQANFANPSLMTSGVAGGFVFTYGGIQQNQQNGTCSPDNTTADYANAIINGIAALPTS